MYTNMSDSQIEEKLRQSNISPSERKDLSDELSNRYADKLLEKVHSSTNSKIPKEFPSKSSSHSPHEKSKITEPPVTSQSPQSKTFLKYPKWRASNTILIIFAFFAPWVFDSCIGELNGYQIALGSGVNIINMLTGEIKFALSSLIFGIGTISILLYGVTNFILIFRYRRVTTKITSSLLIISVVGMSIPIFKGADFENVLWGYWLTWGILFSCIVLEIKSHEANKTVFESGP